MKEIKSILIRIELKIAGRYFLVIFLFGFAVLPFTYIISFYFTEPATGFARISIINIFAGKSF